MGRLVTAGLLPERAGQPAKVLAHISLADLIDLDADSELQKAWTKRVHAQWAAHRAAASVSGSDGGAWLEGGAARAFACDASITPIVTGEVNPAVLEDLVRLCVQLAGYGPEGDSDPCQGQPGPSADQTSPAPCGRDDGRLVAIVADKIRVWEVAMAGKSLLDLFSPNGHLLATGDSDSRFPVLWVERDLLKRSARTWFRSLRPSQNSLRPSRTCLLPL